jgi:sugar lactone lactonase YvrE
MEAALETAWDSKPNTGARPWLSQPVVDPEGRIWSASPFDDQFLIFSKDGATFETWGMSGSDPGQFRFTSSGNGWGAIAFRSDGGFYVADSANHRIQQFDRSRKLVRSWGNFGTGKGELIDPLDLAVDGRNQVFVQSDIRHDVQVFAEDGAFIRLLGVKTGPYLTVTADGMAYVVADDPIPTIRVYAPDGAWTATWDLHRILTFATDVAVTPSGRIFVGSVDSGGANWSYESLLELDRTGRAVHLWPNGTESIAVNAAENRLYATFGDKTPVVVRAYALPAK